MTEVRVLVVDDQQLIREGIASLLGIQPGIAVVGVAADGEEAVRRVRELRPDLVLMDVRMPVMDGVEAARILAGSTKVLMLTTFDDEDYVVRALRAGAVGYLLKDVPAADLADAIRLANSGVTQLASSLAQRLAATPQAAPPATLTQRETEVLRLVATGATNREIAARLYLSEGTVKNHVSRILDRLALRDRTHAAIYARDHGLLQALSGESGREYRVPDLPDRA
ncbi:DNA-binding response regulator, NarL/FixJ family, contains REC and HTH domains [Actinokineospora alba]|uniref:DNA-binding response regulator, NarL/FixJ family, contains REC and HTH domains n=1 Tax=Actinokineospora alba TaxID=504798 RepID=A0A1H0LZZ5_9PSEU|nr:response regulator transcription factor [Actinokineospora alba]TDP67521.1 DNA-binding NarL/FixJ family response regulator [Actinokineospora alba]SDI46526.1 DNA-binding response regulator, NarL/FixJ family, contains REC and HTH domains [Actinokineospora alba]SDO73526.1 DNA-binding response regulator, NarL/FixJ family, contains REC and HTH domains [Actinokineospora alba]